MWHKSENSNEASIKWYIKGRANQLQNSSQLPYQFRLWEPSHTHTHSSNKEQISRVSLRANNSDRIYVCHLTPLHFVFLFAARIWPDVCYYLCTFASWWILTPFKLERKQHAIFPHIHTFLCLFAKLLLSARTRNIYFFPAPGGSARVIFMDWCAPSSIGATCIIDTANKKWRSEGIMNEIYCWKERLYNANK